MLLAFAKGLRIDNDLVFLVHRGHAVIALDCALARGHLGRFVIGDVAFDFFDAFAFTHPRFVLGEESVNLVVRLGQGVDRLVTALPLCLGGECQPHMDRL